MIETNTTQKDWDDFWESVNEDQSIPTERELFESNDDDKSLTNAYVDLSLIHISEPTRPY